MIMEMEDVDVSTKRQMAQVALGRTLNHLGKVLLETSHDDTSLNAIGDEVQSIRVGLAELSVMK